MVARIARWSEALVRADRSPTAIIATTVGVFFGIFSGVNHGVFEVLQGFARTEGLIIDAIGPDQRFWPAGTEPAFTLVPNYLVTGIASIVVGLATAAWSVWFLSSKHGRSVYLLLFVVLFLVGGGIGQAFFFLPAWAFATRMGKPLTWWKRVLPQRTWPALSRLWPVTLVTAVFVMLIAVEMAVFGYFPGVTQTQTLENLNMALVLTAAILFVVSFIAGFGGQLHATETRSSQA